MTIKNRTKLRKFIILLIFICLRNLARFLTQEKENLGKILLVIAHPDDESMFFSPLLYHTKPFVLCLSNGNFNGLGKLRAEELSMLCESLNLKHKILDYKDGEEWDEVNIAKDIISFLETNYFDSIVTFDEHGISGHKNHISCYKAVDLLKKVDRGNVFSFKFLKSVCFFEKYLFYLKFTSYSIPISGILFGFKCMQFHRTQLLWFRYIYCIFSNYMVYNTLV